MIENAKTNTAPVPYATVLIDAADVAEVRSGALPQKTLTKKLNYELGDPEVLADPSLTIDVVVKKRPAGAP